MDEKEKNKWIGFYQSRVKDEKLTPRERQYAYLRLRQLRYGEFEVHFVKDRHIIDFSKFKNDKHPVLTLKKNDLNNYAVVQLESDVDGRFGSIGIPSNRLPILTKSNKKDYPSLVSNELLIESKEDSNIKFNKGLFTPSNIRINLYDVKKIHDHIFNNTNCPEMSKENIIKFNKHKNNK